MRLFRIVPLLILIFLIALTAQAETLYKWVDEKGVQRFSNQPPPEDVDSYETIEGVPESDSSEQGERESYRSMMERVEEENRRSQFLERQKAKERAQEEKRKVEAEREKRISGERQRLEQQIDAINKRALGPKFTEGMRRAQIEEIQKKIEALEKSAP